jgi:RNA recognition motif-containing protein
MAPPSAAPYLPSAFAPSAELPKIFVAGLPLDATAAELRELFQRCGAVVEATIMMDRATGASRGFGFVIFESEEVVERALRDRHELRGRVIDCKRAVPKRPGAGAGTGSMSAPRPHAYGMAPSYRRPPLHQAAVAQPEYRDPSGYVDLAAAYAQQHAAYLQQQRQQQQQQQQQQQSQAAGAADPYAYAYAQYAAAYGGDAAQRGADAVYGPRLGRGAHSLR